MNSNAKQSSPTTPKPISAPSPRSEGFYQPAEWDFHKSCWLAWPCHEDFDLHQAQKEFVGLCSAIADLDPVTGRARGESLDILIPDHATEGSAEAALAGLPVRFHSIPFGDIWLRDTAPIFLRNRAGAIASVRFRFNGWGGKYIMPGDGQVAEKIAATTAAWKDTVREFAFPWVLEGGSVDVDGEGTCLTSRQCLLNDNRNPGMSEAEIEQGLRDALGVEKILWLNQGLVNDHTDGHIDTMARFVSPGKVVCMQATHPSDDPNHRVYEEMARDLESFTDAQGRKLEVIRIPSPGRVVSEEGDVMPASYLNFYIGNTTVVVPAYGVPADAEAVKVIGALFPRRRTVGSAAMAILTGGGAFHCISQQQPAARSFSGGRV